MSDSKTPLSVRLARVGVCCRCGYAGEEEIRCPKASDPPDSCCNHWWDGPPAAVLDANPERFPEAR